MKDLIGAKIKPLDIKSFQKVSDVISFDGPLLSLYLDKGENVLFNWCDCDEKCNRWLVFKVDDRTLGRFLKKELSLKHLVKNPKYGYHYAIDLDDSGDVCSSKIVSPLEIPEDYIPGENSFLREDIKSTFSRDSFKICIDGSWTFYDLRQFPRLLECASAFIYQFIGDAKDTLPKYPMRDGFSSMHFFNELRTATPLQWLSKLETISYASPGSIVVNAKAEGSKALMSVLDAVRPEKSAAKDSYKLLYEVIGENNLRKEDAIRVKLSAELETQLGKLAEDLARDMNLPNPDRIIKESKNILLSCKIILAFYRLTYERILEYERDKKMYFPALQ